MRKLLALLLLSPFAANAQLLNYSGPSGAGNVATSQCIGQTTVDGCLGVLVGYETAWAGTANQVTITGTSPGGVNTNTVSIPSNFIAPGTITATTSTTTPILTISGNVSAANPQLVGFGMTGGATPTYTDTTATGTTTNEALNALPQGTLNSSGAATVTNAYEFYVPAPLCTGNMTCTNRYSIGLANGARIVAGGVNIVNGGLTVSAGATSIAGTVALSGIPSSSAAQTGTVCIGAASALSYDTTTTCLLSAARFKMFIDDLSGVSMLKEVMKLKPVSYYYRSDINGDRFNHDPNYTGQQIGFIAEEVNEVDPRLVTVDPDGQLRSVRYQQMAAMLAGAIQQQQHEIDALKKQVHYHGAK